VTNPIKNYYPWDCLFVPCPPGNFSYETHRLYEALESGAIPIIEDSSAEYYRLLFGDSLPFPIVADWREASVLMKDFAGKAIMTSEALDRWWWQKKSIFRADVMRLIKKLGVTKTSSLGIRDHALWNLDG
jgi:hypothetical protein